MELHPDERILYSESPSWRGQFGSHLLLLVGAILLGAVVLLVFDPDWIGVVVGIVVALLGSGYLFMERIRTKYIITTYRLHVREGFLSKQVQETRLRRIQNVTTNQTVVQRMLGIGTVDYDTAGDNDGGDRFRMEAVRNPDALIRLVDKAQRDVFDTERQQAARAEAEADAEFRARQASPPVDPPRTEPTDRPEPPHQP